jgi:hypothetical protein
MQQSTAIFDRHFLFRAFSAPTIHGLLTHGFALGYYISRLWRRYPRSDNLELLALIH